MNCRNAIWLRTLPGGAIAVGKKPTTR